MFKRPEGYYIAINPFLLDKIPALARLILEFNCGYGLFGEQVKAKNPEIVYYGVEPNLEAAQVAMGKLDYVFNAKIETDYLKLDGITFDCILLGDLLECHNNPEEILRKIRPMLKPDGRILCCMSNIQHHSVLASLLSGDFQYKNGGIMDRAHVRFYTYIAFFKLMLDTGFLARIAQVLVLNPEPSVDFMDHLKSAMASLGNDPVRCSTYINAYQYIFDAVLNPTYSETLPPPFPISFVVPTRDKKGRVLADYFLSSPIFQKPHPHQIILLENQTSGAEMLANGIQQATHDFIVQVHQDIYLPHQFDAILCQQVLQAKAVFNHAEFFAVYGVNYQDGKAVHAGCGSGQHFSGKVGGPFPVQIETVDEQMLAFWKSSFPGADPNLGWHLYGTGMICDYREMGKCAVVVEAYLYHGTTLSGVVPADFMDAVVYFLHSKWQKYLPLATHTLMLPVEGVPYIPFGEQLVIQDALPKVVAS